VPYQFISWPVILGTIGGDFIAIGILGLLYLKIKMDKKPASPFAYEMDVNFLLLLFSTVLSSLILLFLRQTSLMGILLIVHIGFVLTLFCTLPFGKFVHGLYRYLALVRHNYEQLKQDPH